MPNAQELRRLGPPVVRTTWLFQAIIAGSAIVYLEMGTLWIIHLDYYMLFTSYRALKGVYLALFAAMIIFIVIVQRNYPDPHPTVTARFELSKGVLATVVWAWVLLDVIFLNPYDHYDPDQRKKRTRIILAAASAVILLSVPPQTLACDRGESRLLTTA